jgi:hypothetical protein
VVSFEQIVWKKIPGAGALPMPVLSDKLIYVDEVESRWLPVWVKKWSGAVIWLNGQASMSKGEGRTAELLLECQVSWGCSSVG